MSGGQSRGHGPIYPAYCHTSSPTYWKWVKLTAADVHALRTESGYAGMTPQDSLTHLASIDNSVQGQDVYFHLNHPIRYVYLCGNVVAIDYFPRFAILVLDDGSGQTLELKIELVTTPKRARQTTGRDLVTGKAAEDTVKQNELSEAASRALGIKEPATTATVIENVVVKKTCQDPRCFGKHVSVDGRLIEVGMIIKARGTLGRFRSIFQLSLRRISVVEDTEEELRIWRDYSEFCQRILIRPWILTEIELHDLERQNHQRLHEAQQAREQQAHARRAADLKRTNQRERWRVKVQREEERLERRRVREERELDGNALDRPRQMPETEAEKPTT